MANILADWNSRGSMVKAVDTIAQLLSATAFNFLAPVVYMCSFTDFVT